MTIRVATMADLPQILPLSVRLFFETQIGPPPEYHTIEQAHRLFFQTHLNSPLSRTWVAELNQKVVTIGTLAFFIRPADHGHAAAMEAYLVNIYTTPEYRRRGLAGAIVNAAITYSRIQGIHTIWVHATKTGYPIYQAAGFQEVAPQVPLKSA